MLANGLTAGASYDGRTSVTGGRHNLPLFATSFIGREQEIATIRRRLRGTRVLTLCGPGGCGKTRLAIAAAARQVGTQPDGTWLLENTHPGKIHFTLEDGDGRPSRWNTLRALRVLNWYEQSPG